MRAMVANREIRASFRVIYDPDHNPPWGVQAQMPDGTETEVWDLSFRTRTQAQREVDRLRRLFFVLTREEES